jgi:pimeloyl-ACP methyl ester carboxylesterase
MSEANHYGRRRFIGTAVMATAGVGLVGSRWREPVGRNELGAPAIQARASDARRAGKQTDAGDLGYAEAGPSNGPPAILLHEFPHDIDSEVDVAALASRGYRVIVPTRKGQHTVVASDVMALMDALAIEKALVGGCDAMSARTAEVMAALWPQRVKGIVPAGCYDVVNLAATQRPLPPKEELGWWYHYYLVEPRQP